MMTAIARFFLILGVIFLLIGAAIYLLSRLNIPFGRLPGDIRIERDHFIFWFPLGTSILISLVLTLILNLLIRWLGRR